MSEELGTRLAAVAARMRDAGARVGLGELLLAHRALAAVEPSERAEARLALRAALCSCREDLERFDGAFAAVFGAGVQVHGGPLEELGAVAREALPHAAVPGSASRQAGDAREVSAVPAAFSDVELLRETDFAAYDERMVAAARKHLEALARRGPSRRSRRLRATRRRAHAPDLRRTARASLRTGGEPIARFWREPSCTARRLVLVCDVSGSMSPYARMLLLYLHACVAGGRPVEAFTFGTRLTRITHELARRDPEAALARATAAVADLAGGTRIGEAVALLNREHGRRIGRGAVVVVLSDGWDRGDPGLLAGEMARLRRSAHRLIWLNPLAAAAGYEPLTRGMQAAMPHTDILIAGNSLASLERLAEILEES